MIKKKMVISGFEMSVLLVFHALSATVFPLQ